MGLPRGAATYGIIYINSFFYNNSIIPTINFSITKTMNCAEDVTHDYKYITFRWDNPLIRFDVGNDLTVCGKTDLEYYISIGSIGERQVWIYTRPNECNSSVACLIITFIAILIFLI